MAIRVERNEQGNCVNFHGSSNPTYWNACLTAYVDDDVPNTINIVNDIITAQTGVTEYEYFQIPFTEFTRADNSDFATAQEAADYITQAARVIGVSPESSGNDLNGVTVCFKLDDTSTSIILDNGYSFGVNTIKAVAEGGVIEIHSISGDRTLFSNLDAGNVCINDVAVSGGLNDVVNTLNELFTVGAFESVVISDPYSTMIADVDGVADSGSLVGSGVVDPAGNDIGANTGTHNNNAGYLSSETINQAGEYFTFDIRGEGQIGFGLVHTQDSYDNGYYSGNSTYANPSTFCNGTNSSHYGYQFSHFFHPTPNGSWTNYGANTAYSIRSGWNSFPDRQNWLDGNPIKIRVGLDTNGYISIDSYDPNTSTFVPHSRTTYPAPEGAEYKLGIKFSNPAARLYSTPKVHLLEEEAPTMYFRYIESPDGVFQYPLFATEEEANYYDEQNGGSGASHTHVYADDPTSTTWYMPETNAVHNGTSAPLFDLTLGQSAAYTEITSLTNADQVPPAFTDTSITVDELSTINYQLSPVDVGYTTTVGNAYGWTVVNGTTLMGTAPEVTGDNVANPSDVTTVTVYRTNSYGTSQGTLTVNITNLTAPIVNPISGFDFVGGTTLVDQYTMAAGSVVSITETVGDGERVVFNKAWADSIVSDVSEGTGTKRVWIGFKDAASDFSSGATRTGWDLMYEFYNDGANRANNNWRLRVMEGSNQLANVGVGSLTNALYDYVFINDGGVVKIGGLVASQGHNASTYVYDTSDSNWQRAFTHDTGVTGAKTLYIATENTQVDLTTTGISEYTEPVASTNLTNWTKALDFSGSNEYAKQVSTSVYAQPIRMGGLSATAALNPTSGYTSSSTSARPWATAIVFKYDGNNSNQHIWNQGEGAGSTDDNIYLRVTGTGEFYFGWGRQGEINECRLGSWGVTDNLNHWHAFYIASNGYRTTGAAATAANLALGFDIRYMGSNDSPSAFANLTTNLSTSSNWSNGSTGGRMDRSVTGDFTIGGRGSNRSFHGKVASMVVTSLRVGQPMPNDTEIEMMIKDPKQWEQDYRVGQLVRNTNSYTNSTYGANTVVASGYGNTQIWLMGDGASDSYANGIRNEVASFDQNYTKLQLNSMVSNDIQTVNINGLS
jgi:hypothetical protein